MTTDDDECLAAMLAEYLKVEGVAALKPKGPRKNKFAFWGGVEAPVWQSARSE